MCNSKLYHIHVNKLVQNVFFDFVKINALHILIQVCLKFKMVYAYFTRLCHFMPTSDFIAILKSEISKFCIPILAIQKKKSLHGASRVFHTFGKSFAHKP